MQNSPGNWGRPAPAVPGSPSSACCPACSSGSNAT